MMTAATYIETDCTVTHEGRDFTSGGAVVTADHVVGYIGNANTITDWHGRVIGACRVVSSWRLTSSWLGDRMYQIEATIDGALYTGRSLGTGMIWKGKRKASQRR